MVLKPSQFSINPWLQNIIRKSFPAAAAQAATEHRERDWQEDDLSPRECERDAAAAEDPPSRRTRRLAMGEVPREEWTMMRCLGCTCFGLLLVTFFGLLVTGVALVKLAFQDELFQVAHAVASTHTRTTMDAAVTDAIKGVILTLDRFDGVAVSLMARLALYFNATAATGITPHYNPKKAGW